MATGGQTHSETCAIAKSLVVSPDKNDQAKSSKVYGSNAKKKGKK